MVAKGFLSSQLFCTQHCSVDSDGLGLPGFSIPSSQLREFELLCFTLEIPRMIICSNIKGHFIFSPSLKNYYLLLP